MKSYDYVFKYVVACIGCGVVFTVFTMTGRERHIPVMEQLPEDWDNRTRTILLWNPFFELQDYGFGFGDQAFVKNKCEFTNCYLTNNRTYLNPTDFDAIVFHAPRLQSIPSFNSRSYHQRYVFFSLESPVNMDTSQFYDNFYNWTISYRTDSDIPYPYGKFVKNEHKIKSNFDFAEKKKWIAWFVSNCDTKSGRENYVHSLKQYIPVDIYGSCGTDQCPRNSGTCYEMAEKKYKFYLSFENSICKDYVTEKLFNILKYNLVPVVFGGANYNGMLPPHSFINALDYKPKDLAELLTKLGNNEEEYKKYFQWKEEYTVAYPDHPFCELCKKLHTDRTVKTYPDFNKWWRDEKCTSVPLYTHSELAFEITH